MDGTLSAGTRRFIALLLIIISATVLALFDKISGDQALNLLQFVIVGYVIGVVGQTATAVIDKRK